VTIKASAAGQIDALLADLGSDQPVVRDAAVARLAVIGTRAVPRLAKAARDTNIGINARVSSLRALEGIDDDRSLETALALLDDEAPGVVVAAIGIVRGAMTGPRGVATMDRIVALALDVARAESVREAALQALGDLESATVEPLLEVLTKDRQPGVRKMALLLKKGDRREPDDAAAVIAASARGELPDEPDLLKRALVQAGTAVPLPDLRSIVDVLRDREATAGASARARWLQVRATVHAILARRKSRLAVFDLRETVAESTSALPVEFLAALEAVGDPSCLEAVAAAWERSGAHQPREAWQRHLADAFQAIASREGLTARHAVMKRISRRWPRAFEALRATPR